MGFCKWRMIFGFEWLMSVASRPQSWFHYSYPSSTWWARLGIPMFVLLQIEHHPWFIPKRRLHLILDYEEDILAIIDIVPPLLDPSWYISIPYLIIPVIHFFCVKSVRPPMKYIGCIYSTIISLAYCSWHEMDFVFPFHTPEAFSPIRVMITADEAGKNFHFCD